MNDRFTGALDGVRARRLQGWVRALDPDAPKARIRVLLDDAPVALLPADQPRADLAAAGLGDGAHAFSLDLTPFLAGRRGQVRVRVLVAEDGMELPGSPLLYRPPAEGRAERFHEGWLLGWAHGPDLAPARVVLRAEGQALLAWPCDEPRPDLVEAGIGDGTHGFRIPVLGLLGPVAPAGLELRIEGEAEPLPLPPWPGPPADGLPSAMPPWRFPDAAAARAALLLASRDRGGWGRPASLSAALLHRVLDRLAVLENGLAEAREHKALLATRRPAPAPLPPAARQPGPAVAALHALLRQAPTLPAPALPAAAAALVPPYRAASAGERSRFRTALGKHAGAPVLDVALQAFRAADFLDVPAEAAARLAAFGPTSEAVRVLRLLRSWHAAARRPPPLPPVQLQAPRGGRPTLYALWRSAPYDTNGYATRSHYLLRALGAVGEAVTGVTRLGYPWDAEAHLPARAQVEAVEGVRYLHLGAGLATRETLPLDAYLRDCAWRIAQAAVAGGAGVIHSASNWMAALPALMAARLVGLPFSYELRGLWEVTRAGNVPGYNRTDHYALFHALEAYVAREADLVHAITSGVREELGRRGVDTARIRLLPNGCDTARFTPVPRDAALAAELGLAEDETVFGYLGTFARYEGLPDLVRAALELHRRGGRCRLLLVGDGPAREEVAALLAAHDAGGRVLLRGRVPFAEVPRLYSVVDVAVFPRIGNAITEMVSPLKPFEAMAMGKPVIGSDVRAIADIVRPGHTGWLFRKDDLGALVEAMEAALDAPEAVRRMGEAARRFVVRDHDWTAIAARLAAGWAELRDRSSG